MRLSIFLTRASACFFTPACSIDVCMRLGSRSQAEVAVLVLVVNEQEREQELHVRCWPPVNLMQANARSLQKSSA
eukprot:771383-Pleurochrysis_carterae.AAC.7